MSAYSPTAASIEMLAPTPSRPIKTLFLDQTGKLGGAELVLLDVARFRRDRCLVGLFEDGLFKDALENSQVPVQVLTTQTIQVRRESGLLTSVRNAFKLVPLIFKVAKLSQQYDLIYVNTLKALVVGAIASGLSRKPLVFHLHDILSEDHFSASNRLVIIKLVNCFAHQVIAISASARDAFVQAGGRAALVQVVHNGFDPQYYQAIATPATEPRSKFVVGHFSRLSPWKGQHVLLHALTYCPDDVTAILVGEALFGETAYDESLREQVIALGLQDRVQFLGFRSDIPQLMAQCNLIAHTSIAPEPFGRVIVEGMLCGKPVVAAAAGGALELITHGQTGWLCPPDSPRHLAEMILQARNYPRSTAHMSDRGRRFAQEHFHIDTMNQKIEAILQTVMARSTR